MARVRFPYCALLLKKIETHDEASSPATSTSEKCEVSLTAHVANKDEEFERIYRKLKNYICTVAFRRLRDEPDSRQLADEIAQDSFLDLYRQWDDVHRHKKFFHHCK